MIRCTCGGEKGNHIGDCSRIQPRRFKWQIPNGTHPTGRKTKYQYGCYFPYTDLVVGDMGGRGTGIPQDVEWIDDKPQY